MSVFALALVAGAALVHPGWNLLTKRSRDKLLFLWWAGLWGTLSFLPAVLTWTPGWSWSTGAWLGVGVAAVIRAAYFASLGVAYTRGDLSLVYPLARGSAPVLVPVLATLFLGERLSVTGVLAVGLVALGVYVLHLPGFGADALRAPLDALRSGHARYATLTGLLTATYSVVDKWNISTGIPPLTYGYLTIPVAGLLLTPVALRRPDIIAEWRAHAWAMPVAAVMMTSGYVLVLTAMQVSAVSYVAAARELGIVFSTVFGSVILGERHLPPRFIGAGIIVPGVLALGLAP